MKFPWHKYEELPLERRNTLQVFITNECNLRCKGCFARYVMKDGNKYMDFEEYEKVVSRFLDKRGKQINIMGGEPLMHPMLEDFLTLNQEKGIKTTIYTNGYFMNRYSERQFHGAKLRVSVYCQEGKVKSVEKLPRTDTEFDPNFMVTKNSKVEELLESAEYLERNFNSKVFFIFSMRELDNPRQEFFDDTENTMPVIEYKELVHNFMTRYKGNMDIHVSKRGVFESTKTLPDRKCRFANYFIGGKIIQCPYDIVNLKFQDDYEFGKRNCQQNNTCLMSKVIYRRK